LTYTTQGTHVITWNFANGNGNSIDVNQNVIIDDITKPVIPVLADITGECSVILTAPTTTDNCAGKISGTTSAPTEYITNGIYVVTWNFADGNGNSIDVNQNVLINNIPDYAIPCNELQTRQLSDGETAYKVVGTEFDLIASSDICDGFSVVNDFNDLATLDEAELPIGLTTVVWTIKDPANNEIQCSFDVQVNTFVGIETLQQKGILIYPNPTNGIVNFEFANNNIQQITILDITGKKITERTEINRNEVIDLSGFGNGIYIVKINTDKEIFTTEIIKE